MLYKDIAKILGLYLFVLTILLMIPFFLALYYQFFDPSTYLEQPVAIYFLESSAISLILALCLYFIGRYGSVRIIFRREALSAVVLIWFITPAISALPFILSGTVKNPFVAYFEMTSGFTTTGATALQAKQYDESGNEIPIHKIITGVSPKEYVFFGTVVPIRLPNQKIIREGIEALPRALLFWRSFSQFIGGGGIIVLFVAILPMLGVGGKILFQTEMTGPVKSAIAPRIKESAFMLWKVYVGLNILEMVFLLITNPNMPILDALTISFSTISTGGFSIKNQSIASYHNTYTNWVVLIFMILGSINFALYYHVLVGKFYRIYEPEFIVFIILLLSACWLGSYYLVSSTQFLVNGESTLPFSWSDAIQYGFFQVVSAHTTTGFVTANYDFWPYPTQAIMLITMFLGGMSGSTAGGIKIIRHLILFRIAQYKVESLFRPEAVRKFRVGDREVDYSVAIMVLCFFLTLTFVSVLGTFVYIIDGCDPETALGLVACMINNTGIAFRMAGPLDSCAFLSNFSLAFSSILMILGRLEFFAVLAILVPAFWKQNT